VTVASPDVMHSRTGTYIAQRQLRGRIKIAMSLDTTGHCACKMQAPAGQGNDTARTVLSIAPEERRSGQAPPKTGYDGVEFRYGHFTIPSVYATPSGRRNGPLPERGREHGAHSSSTVDP
jgi:hypothetical protein